MIIKSKNIILNINNTLSNEFIIEKLSLIESELQLMEHPFGSGKFKLYPKKKSNGVTPIKINFMNKLKNHGWHLEHRLDLGVTTNKAGPIDATYPFNCFDNRYIALEWETGNISSSHRAINKMVLGLLNEIIVCGVLVLPSREMYKLLTDRVGNFAELEPYLDVWMSANYNIKSGALVIYEIEHDETSEDIKPLQKGTDGRALK